MLASRLLGAERDVVQAEHALQPAISIDHRQPPHRPYAFEHRVPMRDDPECKILANRRRRSDAERAQPEKMLLDRKLSR